MGLKVTLGICDKFHLIMRGLAQSCFTIAGHIWLPSNQTKVAPILFYFILKVRNKNVILY